MSDSGNNATRYWTYISYSHADTRAAVAIHRRLERFSIPPAIAGRRIGDLQAGKSLRPVFLDREDLSSSGSLSRSIDEALRRSQSLVVLCSPRAARSEWVNKEIQRFVELHGRQHVLALILEGNPGVDDETECFPPALRGDLLEPIAGDMQKTGDGPRDGVLKVIAGILRVPFDKLKQREAHQRHRKMVGITALAATIALSTSLLALYAFQQRNFAVEQQQLADQRRVQAEDLITFMLGDLRERLAGLGRLDVLEAVGDKATSYFESLPPSELNSVTLAAQANALRQIGEIRIQQGRYAESQVAFRVALAQMQELQERNPKQVELIFDRSQAEYWVGYSHYLARDYVEAERYFLLYQESAAELVELEPDNPDYRIELAYAYSNLGTVSQSRHDSGSALISFQKCREIFYALSVANPDDLDMLFEVAATDSWLGRVHASVYEMNDALAFYERSAATHARVSDLSGHFFHRQMEAESLSNLSTVRFSVGDSETALQDETRAADIYRELVAHDEENVDWLLRALNHESQVLWLDITVNPGSGKQRGMNTILRRAEAVASTDPDNGDWAKHVSDIALNTLFAALFESDEELVDELLPRYANRSSLPVDIRVADSDAVEDYLRSMLALSIRSRQLHNIDDAISHANAALAQIDPHPEIVARNLETAVILHRVAGNASTANQLEEQMMVQGFRSPGYVRTLGLLN